MASITIEPGEVHTLATTLADSSRQIADSLDTLTAKSRTLMSQWSGEAANSFLAAEIDWNASMARINAILAEAARVASDTASHYEATDAAVGRMWGM